MFGKNGERSWTCSVCNHKIEQDTSQGGVLARRRKNAIFRQRIQAHCRCHRAKGEAPKPLNETEMNKINNALKIRRKKADEEHTWRCPLCPKGIIKQEDIYVTENMRQRAIWEHGREEHGYKETNRSEWKNLLRDQWRRKGLITKFQTKKKDCEAKILEVIMEHNRTRGAQGHDLRRIDVPAHIEVLHDTPGARNKWSSYDNESSGISLGGQLCRQSVYCQKCGIFMFPHAYRAYNVPSSFMKDLKNMIGGECGSPIPYINAWGNKHGSFASRFQPGTTEELLASIEVIRKSARKKGSIPGMSESDTKKLYDEAIELLEDIAMEKIQREKGTDEKKAEIPEFLNGRRVRRSTSEEMADKQKRKAEFAKRRGDGAKKKIMSLKNYKGDINLEVLLGKGTKAVGSNGAK